LSWCALALEHSPSRPLALALVALAVPMHCCRLGPEPLLAPPSPLPFLSRWKSGGGEYREAEQREEAARAGTEEAGALLLSSPLASMCRPEAPSPAAAPAVLHMQAAGPASSWADEASKARARHQAKASDWRRWHRRAGRDARDPLPRRPGVRACAHHVAHAPEQARNRRATGDAEQVDVRHGAHGGTSTCCMGDGCMGDAEYAAGGACGCAAT